MWHVEDGEAIRSGFKKVAKSHPAEYDACFANLEKILNLGNKDGKAA